MPPRVLVLNPGSSSLKASLIEPPDRTIASVEASWGADASRTDGRADGLADALARLGLGAGAGPDAVGYRVVHGGARFREAVVIDGEVLDGIREVGSLAPLHNGVALETIEAGRARLPDVPHVACFDTAFHATLEPAAFRYPVPERWYGEWGVRRYGFHGLSVAWSVGQASADLGRPVEELCLVVAHLGSGCSVTAVDGGRSVETSMGLTPLEGLMMGTRSGSIDPGVAGFLARHGFLGTDEVEDALDHASGLLGVSGSSSDMRELLAAAGEGDERAALAIAMFERRAAAWIAAVATSLPRLDALVFTGGIGEHAEPVRRGIVARLGVLGIDGIAVLRIEAREDLVIAREVAALM